VTEAIEASFPGPGGQLVAFILEEEEDWHMVKARWILLAAAFTFFAVCVYAAEKKVTLEGTLVDSKCYLADHSLTGNDHMGTKNCGTICLKQGNPAGLLTREKHFHILVAPALALAPYVGQEVRITGADHEGVIAVEKAEVHKDGKWEDINLKAMM
jgi:hypothetical protein